MLSAFSFLTQGYLSKRNLPIASACQPETWILSSFHCGRAGSCLVGTWIKKLKPRDHIRPKSSDSIPLLCSEVWVRCEVNLTSRHTDISPFHAEKLSLSANRPELRNECYFIYPCQITSCPHLCRSFVCFRTQGDEDIDTAKVPNSSLALSNGHTLAAKKKTLSV